MADFSTDFAVDFFVADFDFERDFVFSGPVVSSTVSFYFFFGFFSFLTATINPKQPRVSPSRQTVNRAQNGVELFFSFFGSTNGAGVIRSKFG